MTDNFCVKHKCKYNLYKGRRGMKRKLLVGLLALSFVMEGAGMTTASVYGATGAAEKVLVKSDKGNPVLGFGEDGGLLYGGDPAVLVDGDVAYFYVGHDASNTEDYHMPDWRCYSTRNMKDFKYEGEIMKCSDIPWADDDSSWASQVVKYGDKYYLYYCAEENTNAHGKCIGVAVSDSPTGKFKDIGQPLVYDDQTPWVNPGRGGAGWEDIDPTAWVETDENGVEHRYLLWGNTNAYLAELNEDMTSLKDMNGDGKISFGKNAPKDGDIQRLAFNGLGNSYFAEAPWLYRRKDEKGNYYGKYYLFFARHWRESMAYLTADDMWQGTWQFGRIVMEPTATSNTNHMAVVDFKGKTYFIYHNGSLPWGSGFRRSVCIDELKFDKDGNVEYLQETSVGLSGLTSTIKSADGKAVSHVAYNNSYSDGAYPYTNVKVGMDISDKDADQKWEIEAGKADDADDAYVSIESYNKPGLFLQVESDKSVTMGQDYRKATSDGFTADSKRMTFRTLEGFDKSVENGTTFESVKYPGYYLTAEDGKLLVTQNPDSAACTFVVDTEEKEEKSAELSSIAVRKTDRTYVVGESLNKEDIRLTAYYSDNKIKLIKDGFKVDDSAVDMTRPGVYKLKVTCEADGKVLTGATNIRVVANK